MSYTDKFDEWRRKAQEKAKELEEKYKIKDRIDESLKSASDVVRTGAETVGDVARASYDAVSNSAQNAQREFERLDQEHKITENIKENVKQAREKAEQTLRSSAETASQTVKSGTEIAEQVVKSGTEKANTVASEITEKASAVVENLGEKASTVADSLGLGEKANTVATDLGEKTREAAEVAKDYGEKIREVASDLGQKASETAKDLGGKAWETAKDYSEKAREKAHDYQEKARDYYQKASDAYSFAQSANRAAGSISDTVNAAIVWAKENPAKAALASFSLLLGFGVGSQFPKFDVVVLGAKGHWFFRSALLAYGSRKLSEKYLDYLKEQETLIKAGHLTEAERQRIEFQRSAAKYVGAPLLGAFNLAAGVAIWAEIFSPDRIVGFPIDILLGDDPMLKTVWLFSNGLICIHNGYEFIMMAVADEEVVKRTVRDIKGLLPSSNTTAA
jgi:gas vesicle protein